MKWPFKKAYQKGITQGYLEAEAAVVERRKADYEVKRSVERETFTGKKVIVITNNYEDPLVGVCVGFDDFGKPWPSSQFPVVVNALTKEKLWSGGIISIFSENRLKAVMAMDPFTRWDLMSQNGRCFDDAAPKAVAKRPDIVLKNYDQLIAELNAVGFLKDEYVLN